MQALTQRKMHGTLTEVLMCALISGQVLSTGGCWKQLNLQGHHTLDHSDEFSVKSELTLHI